MKRKPTDSEIESLICNAKSKSEWILLRTVKYLMPLNRRVSTKEIIDYLEKNGGIPISHGSFKAQLSELAARGEYGLVPGGNKAKVGYGFVPSRFSNLPQNELVSQIITHSRIPKTEHIKNTTHSPDIEKRVYPTIIKALVPLMFDIGIDVSNTRYFDRHENTDLVFSRTLINTIYTCIEVKKDLSGKSVRDGIDAIKSQSAFFNSSYLAFVISNTEFKNEQWKGCGLGSLNERHGVGILMLKLPDEEYNSLQNRTLSSLEFRSDMLIIPCIPKTKDIDLKNKETMIQAYFTESVYQSAA